MKIMIAVLIATGSCLVEGTGNHIPNIVPQQPILGVMMMHVALGNPVHESARKQDKLLPQKCNQNQVILPKNQKFPKQKNYNRQQSRR